MKIFAQTIVFLLSLLSAATLAAKFFGFGGELHIVFLSIATLTCFVVLTYMWSIGGRIASSLVGFSFLAVALSYLATGKAPGDRDWVDYVSFFGCAIGVLVVGLAAIWDAENKQ